MTQPEYQAAVDLLIDLFLDEVISVEEFTRRKKELKKKRSG